eukprot:5656879-Ditylum_brightwellii.AAC.1
MIDNKGLVISKLLFCNKLHLNKAWEIPCAKGPLKEYIGDYGLGEGAQDVLDGNFDPNRGVAADSSIEVEITLDNYKVLTKAQNESTSSLPSGQRYTHYKAIFENDNIGLVHIQMMSMPYVPGFTPSRWEKAIDCMLEKGLGDHKVKDSV